MIYLNNNTKPQEIFIERNDGNGNKYIPQPYLDGYEDGMEYQKSLLSSTTFTENGEYERENGWSAITVNVEPSLEEINVVISADTTTITPSSGYDGFSAATVDATEYGQQNYENGFDDGFTDGYSSGASEGYDSGYTEGYQSGSTDGYESGYTSGQTDGYNSGYTEGYDSGSTDGFNSGYTSGETHQKSLLVSTAFTENGEYTRENGYSAITVNIDTASTYSDGYIDGENAIIATFSSTTVTENGQYGSSANPLSSITVNVDTASTYQSGYTSGYTSGSTDGYESGYTEGYNSGYTSGETDGYNSGYTSGETDGFNSGYTSGETHQKSLLGTTAFTINGSYSAENGYSAITVNVPTGQTYNIEQNKPFTATSNGNYTITPTSASTTVTDHFDSDNDRFYCTIDVDIDSYPSVGYFELVRIEDEFDESKGYIDIYINNGVLDYDNIWNPRSDADINSYSDSIDIVIYNANRYVDWSPLEYFDYHYDVMSAVTLVVNVPQSGSTEKDIVICTSGGCWFNMNYQIEYGDVFEIEHCTFGKAGAVSFSHHQYLGGNNGELFRLGEGNDDIYLKYFNNSITLYSPIPQVESVFQDNTIVYSSTAFTVDGNIISSYTTNYSSEKGTLIVFANTDDGGDMVENQTAKIGRLKVYASDGTLKATFEPRLDEFNVPYFKYIEQDIDIYASGGTPFYEEIIIDPTYQSGYTDGQNSIISTFTAMTATTNGVYGSSASPYSSITVNVPQTGSSATLGVGSFSTNGTYSASTDNLDGYSAITINVPTSGGGSNVRYVEYLETDGTKYGWQIPLNVNRNTKIEMDFMPLNGNPNSDGWYNFFLTNGNQSNLTTYWGGYSLDDVGGSFLGGEFDPRTSFSSGTRYLFTIENGSVKVDNVQIATVTPQSLNASSSTIYINSSSDFQRSPIARYYGFKAYENGTLVWDLRPCLDQNNNPCFYEVISGIYYYHTKFDSSQGDPIDPSYKNGYTDGVDYQKSLLTSYTAYTDGVYSTENGYSAFTVAVPPIIAYSRVFSANGIYNPSDYNCDYWSTIQIDVPQSGGGSSDINKLIDRSITSIEIPSGVTTIGAYAFANCESLTSVTIPNTVTSFDKNAFYCCTSLSLITIPNGVTSLAPSLFSGCTSLSEITIPSGITKIGLYCFQRCYKLKTIYAYPTTAPSLSSNTSSLAPFSGVSSTGIVHYPQGSDYSSWQSAKGISGWTFVGDL